MKEAFIKIVQACGKLINVKSIVTLVLTLVFAYLAIIGTIGADQFLTIFTVIISFYYGTQHEKKDKEQTEKEG